MPFPSICRLRVACFALLFSCASLLAQDVGTLPAPTYSDNHYGPAERQVLDFWRASSEPADQTPLVIYIHGGGYVKGDKGSFRKSKVLPQLLAAGISCASLNYRYLSPDLPLQEAMSDSARAVQYLRSRAAEWGIDPSRIAAFGHSAGAGTSMWLAFHDDMADPASSDPVARMSTRLTCVGSIDGQFTYDLQRWRGVFGDAAYKTFSGQYQEPWVYGFNSLDELLSKAGQITRSDLDFYAQISADDPPAFITARLPNLDLTNVNQYLHHPSHSKLVYERCLDVGVEAVGDIPACEIAPSADSTRDLVAFFKAHLLRRD